MVRQHQRAGNCGVLLTMFSSLLLTACHTATESTLLGVGLVTAFGGQAPTQEIEQIYYLGVYDPQQQIPEAVYRIRVHGQASVISFMRFASGWVPAKFVDSLNTSLGFQGATTQPTITTGDQAQTGELNVGRRLILFGPQGFRESAGGSAAGDYHGGESGGFFQGHGPGDGSGGAGNAPAIERGV